MQRLSGLVSPYMEKKIRQIAQEKKKTIYKLISLAIDNEMQKENPFELDLTLPNQFSPYTFAEESEKIKSYMVNLTLGMELEYLLLMRYEMGIFDKITFLAAFKDCLDNNFIESFVPPETRKDGTKRPEGIVYYRVKGKRSSRAKELQQAEYARYKRLKKKFENSQHEREE
jgi:hypothetical protein